MSLLTSTAMETMPDQNRFDLVLRLYDAFVHGKVQPLLVTPLAMLGQHPNNTQFNPLSESAPPVRMRYCLKVSRLT